MNVPAADALGLIVRSAPWEERSGREALDLALAAAVMDQPLRLFFLGDGLLQLVDGRDGSSAGLPLGQKAWASLPDLVDTTVHCRAQDPLAQSDLAWWLRPEPLDDNAWQAALVSCRRLLVL